MSEKPSPHPKQHRSSRRAPFTLDGQEVEAGQREQIPLTVGTFLTHEELNLNVTVVHGKKPGPTLLLTAGIHGDEYNGTEIIRRILRHKRLSRLSGTLLAVPIVNRPGFVTRSRYLPDRRDLNRLFPGSATGSLGGRLARVLTEEILPHADAVIDLHTGAVNRPNFPQIRISPDSTETLELARVFDPPLELVQLNLQLHQGTFVVLGLHLVVIRIGAVAGEFLRSIFPTIPVGR